MFANPKIGTKNVFLQLATKTGDESGIVCFVPGETQLAKSPKTNQCFCFYHHGFTDDLLLGNFHKSSQPLTAVIQLLGGRIRECDCTRVLLYSYLLIYIIIHHFFQRSKTLMLNLTCHISQKRKVDPLFWVSLACLNTLSLFQTTQSFFLYYCVFRGSMKLSCCFPNSCIWVQFLVVYLLHRGTGYNSALRWPFWRYFFLIHTQDGHCISHHRLGFGEGGFRSCFRNLYSASIAGI